MKKRMYAIRDSKVGVYQTPFIGDSDAAMIRAFGDLLETNKDSIYTLHPDDFVLCFLGTFDEELGIFASSSPEPIMLARGSDFAKKEHVSKKENV